MHLKQLKLAGFKSFVDLTVIPFSSPLVAVVGPNGCGKSNIIDAVRWVMGESSAKNLRGESMVDVIFNGSSQRKPVGQASVELVFDNSLGRLMGQYAAYQEISIKRIVTRDGESAYFLNGSRCRRRDITELFLGTGSGSRGYSIISQGTISRFVEARPEELRAYIEEAAGVSKYKERRRETLTRVGQTRENLARVADIRDELDKQLRRLERQAKTAERYKVLREEERCCRTDILALKWKAFTDEQCAKQHEIKQHLLEYEDQQAQATEAYKNYIISREKQHHDNDAFQQIQANFYQLATEIARLEESDQQRQREKERLSAEQEQMQIEWQKLTHQLTESHTIKQQEESNLIQLLAQVELKKIELSKEQHVLTEKQAQRQSTLEKFQQVKTNLEKIVHQKDVQQIQLEHVKQQRQQVLVCIEKIKEEQSIIESNQITESLEKQYEIKTELTHQVQGENIAYQQLLKEGNELRQQLLMLEKVLHQEQDRIHELTTQHAQFTAVQAQVLQKEKKQSITDPQWHDKSRLLDLIKVEKEWQKACEFVLADALSAVVIQSIEGFLPAVHSLKDNSIALLTPCQDSVSPTPKPQNYPCLADKMQGLQPQWTHHLAHIYTAETLSEAIMWAPNLSNEESVITADGYWIGHGWIRGIPSQVEGLGVLARQELIEEFSGQLKDAQAQLIIQKETRDQLHIDIKNNDAQQHQAKQAYLKTEEILRSCETEIRHQKQSLEQLEVKKGLLALEIDELTLKLEELVLQQMDIEEDLLTEQVILNEREQQYHLIKEENNQWETLLAIHYKTVEETRDNWYKVQMQWERDKLKVEQISKNISYFEQQLETLKNRMERLSQALTALEPPNRSQETSLQEKKKQQDSLQLEISLRQDKLSQLTSELDFLERSIRDKEKEAKQRQEQIQQLQLQEQALAVRAANIQDAANELEVSLEMALEALSSEATLLLKEQMLQELTENIKRLGPINLAAIEEYDYEFQRKHHLDEQYQDLTEALSILEAAIEKMDRETQQRLQTTFDAINLGFQSLFPKLFGGGSARLELTCANLLEAGVVVMAQPPGKRNSTIHLLSGGEKAMTAVALVFAIFQLTPSPFCMLDEVDAPLDEVNVGRFCNLVKEMSQVVQFLLITHNKVTMELAEHLIGVTMREPGVSRIVAVDVQQALSMTEPSTAVI